MYLLGYDIGSSSVKACLIDEATGQTCAAAQHPENEMPITALRPGWAEQHPDLWWGSLKAATAKILRIAPGAHRNIRAIGISYQMHGLVCVDATLRPLRPAIIWCDSRAVPYGGEAFKTIGKNACLAHLLNSPGNFTAAKLAWVKENEPDLFARIHQIMLPGDYIAARLTGKICTTASGLSEGIFWDFIEERISSAILQHFGFDPRTIPAIVPTFGMQGEVTAAVASELGLATGIPVCYRAGDQPNNAFALGVLQPGQIAATAGTSGVVYGVNETIQYDPASRVNTFLHVNHQPDAPRTGVLLCINGTGILNSWARKQLAGGTMTYAEMNATAAEAPVGAGGISILPFGNGAERILRNREPGCIVHGINFNIHNIRHLLRAVQEGIVFSLKYGMEVMETVGVCPNTIRAGNANMFLSPLFRQALADVTGATIELFDTDGAAGAARGAGVGAGVYASPADAAACLHRIETVTPNPALQQQYADAYQHWKKLLQQNIEQYLVFSGVL